MPKKPVENSEDQKAREFKLLTDKIVGDNTPTDWDAFGSLVVNAKTPSVAAKLFFLRLCGEGEGSFTLFVEDTQVPDDSKKKKVFGYVGTRTRKPPPTETDKPTKKTGGVPPQPFNLVMKAHKG